MEIPKQFLVARNESLEVFLGKISRGNNEVISEKKNLEEFLLEFPKDVLDVLNESVKKIQKKSLQDSLEKAWKDVPGGIFE